LLLINFSLVAILMLRKLYERFALGRERAWLYLRQIDQCPQLLANSEGRLVQVEVPSLEGVWKEGRRRNERDYPFFSFVRLHHLWESLLIGSGAVGILVLCYFRISPKWWLCWIAGLAGPVFQGVLLWGTQWWEKNKETVKRGKKPSRLFTRIRALWRHRRMAIKKIGSCFLWVR
jgi:hypothetical protein